MNISYLLTNRKVGKLLIIFSYWNVLHIFIKKSAFFHYVCDLEESQGDGIAYD